MKNWIGAAMMAATLSLGGAFASAPALADAQTTHKAAPDNKAKATDFSAQRRHRHVHHRHHFGHRHYGHRHYGYRSYYGPRYGYGYGYRPYRSYYGPAYYGRPYAYRPYGYYGGYHPYGAYGYGPGFGFGGGPLSVGFSFGRW